MQTVSQTTATLVRLGVLALVWVFLGASLAFGQEPAAAPVDPLSVALPTGAPWWAGTVLAVGGMFVAAARWAAKIVEGRLSADDASRVEYRRGVETRLRALEDRLAGVDTRLALTQQAIEHVRDTLRAAAN